MIKINENVAFQPMKLGTYFANRKWSLPSDMDSEAPGYLIMNSEGLTVWIEEAEFEQLYGDSLRMSFGCALDMLKSGCKVARTGWNGKGMFIVYRQGYMDGIPCNEATAKAFGYKEGDLFIQRPYLQMRCADGTHQMWLASQSDLLADDWCIVE